MPRTKATKVETNEPKKRTRKPKPVKAFEDMTEDEIRHIIDKRKEAIPPEEQECTLGSSAADDFYRLDICMMAVNVKYMILYNAAVKKGNGRVCYWDNTHVSYEISKDLLHPFDVIKERKPRGEGAEKAKERMENLNNKKAGEKLIDALKSGS